VGRIGRFDVENADLPEKEYDLIECMEVIEHVTDVPMLLKNIRHALKDNGSVIISTPNAIDWYERNRSGEKWYPHVRAYTARSLAVEAMKAGFMPRFIFSNEGILNMLLDKCEPNELAYTEFEPRGQRQLHEIRKGIRIEGPIQIQVDVDGFDPKEFHKRTAQEPLPPVVKEAYLAVGHVIQGVMLGD
jgi:SAM-dependent methyltransferase